MLHCCAKLLALTPATRVCACVQGGLVLAVPRPQHRAPPGRAVLRCASLPCLPCLTSQRPFLWACLVHASGSSPCQHARLPCGLPCTSQRGPSLQRPTLHLVLSALAACFPFAATLRAYGAAPQAAQLPTSPMGSPSFPHTPFCHSLAFPDSSPAKAAAAAQLCPAAASLAISQLGPMPTSVEAPAGGGNRVSPFAAGQACPNAPAFAAHPGAAAMQPPPCWATTAGGAGSSALLPGVPSTADLGVVRPHASLSLSLQPSGGRSSPGEGSPMANSVSARPPLRSGADLATYEVVDAAYTDTWDPKGRSHSGVVGSDTFRAPPQAAAVAAELPSFAAAVELAPSDVVAAPARSSPAAVPAGVQGSLGVVELPGADEKMLPLALNMSWDFDLDIAGLAGIAAC